MLAELENVRYRIVNLDVRTWRTVEVGSAHGPLLSAPGHFSYPADHTHKKSPDDIGLFPDGTERVPKVVDSSAGPV